jgi:hypothetical protein
MFKIFTFSNLNLQRKKRRKKWKKGKRRKEQKKRSQTGLTRPAHTTHGGCATRGNRHPGQHIVIVSPNI